ncbi:MAG TPA: MxaK protein [Methylophaga aminisulfidivorans]|uniref:MxaK protein n=2 Tax=root TaxID=1 RepID=A0A7C1ZQR4_9GAMM|nr:MxaK protein [Methylophaga aminisulfidivorans]HEC73345.1 MxaK protein [Methylophaga aminisulfidivorans]
MNKPLHILRIILILLIISSAVWVLLSAMNLWQETKLQAYISAPSDYEEIPADPRAHFVKAADLVAAEENDLALEQLTLMLGNADPTLMALGYYNRANINLRQALTMDDSDGRQLPLVELAKQDYRSALEMDPMLWDARYNLEVALRVVPEDPDINPDFEKNVISSQRSIESKAFKIDLP